MRINHPKMTDRTPDNHPPKEVKQHTGAVKGLNDDDLNNRAFILVTAFVFFCDMKKLNFLPYFHDPPHPYWLPPSVNRRWQRHQDQNVKTLLNKSPIIYD